jgi:hypothetical protein
MWLFWAADSRSVSWEMRRDIAEAQPVATIVLIFLMAQSIWVSSKFGKAVPILEPQALSVTSSEIVGHNGKEFFRVPVDDITSVYADYMKPNHKEGQYTDGSLVIISKDKSIEFRCFTGAYNVANVINTILLELSTKSLNNEVTDHKGVDKVQILHNVTNNETVSLAPSEETKRMTFCTNCGVETTASASFCKACGSKIS